MDGFHTNLISYDPGIATQSGKKNRKREFLFQISKKKKKLSLFPNKSGTNATEVKINQRKNLAITSIDAYVHWNRVEASGKSSMILKANGQRTGGFKF